MCCSSVVSIRTQEGVIGDEHVHQAAILAKGLVWHEWDLVPPVSRDLPMENVIGGIYEQWLGVGLSDFLFP